MTRHYRDGGADVTYKLIRLMDKELRSDREKQLDAAVGFPYNQAVTNQRNRFDRTRKGAAWNFGQIKP